MKNKFTTAAVTGTVLLGSVLGAGTAFAATDTATPEAKGDHPRGMMGKHGERPVVFGTVTGINGSLLTVTGKIDPRTSTAEGTYSVDATNATVTKSGSASSVSALAVGDTVMVAGTVSGTSITATSIRDGVPQGKSMGSPNSAAFEGNGQPVVGGTVTALSGSVLTITNKSNVTYTVDASSAAVTLRGATSTLSSVAVGNEVLVQGTVNGTSVTAATVLNQGSPKTAEADATGTQKGQGGGFFGAIGGFFHNLFGFF